MTVYLGFEAIFILGDISDSIKTCRLVTFCCIVLDIQLQIKVLPHIFENQFVKRISSVIECLVYCHHPIVLCKTMHNVHVLEEYVNTTQYKDCSMCQYLPVLNNCGLKIQLNPVISGFTRHSRSTLENSQHRGQNKGGGKFQQSMISNQEEWF